MCVGGGGDISSLQKWKIQEVWRVQSEIPSMVGVWAFSGTSHFWPAMNSNRNPSQQTSNAIVSFQKRLR